MKARGGRRASILIALAAWACAWAPASHAAPAPADSVPPGGAAAPRSSSAPTDSMVLEVVGRVMRGPSAALAGAAVFLEGTRRDATQANHDGRFHFRVVLPGRDGLVRSPASLWLDARQPGYRIALAGGAPRLRVELRAFDDSVGSRHVSVQSNDREVTAAIARALKNPTRADTVRVQFMGVSGKQAPPSDLAMGHRADVVVHAGPAPISARVESAIVADSTAGSPPASASAKTSSSAPRTAPPSSASSTTTSSTAVLATPDTCTCRVEGTIEVQSDRPLSSRVPVAVWLEGSPSERDSVELALGSPRAFSLGNRRCTPQRILYKTYSRTRFERLSGEPVADCRGRRMIQVKIVLRPPGGMP